MPPLWMPWASPFSPALLSAAPLSRRVAAPGVSLPPAAEATVLLYSGATCPDNAPLMPDRQTRPAMRYTTDRQHRRRPWRASALALVVLAGAALVVGCDNQASDKSQAEVVRPGTTQVARSAGTRSVATRATQTAPATLRDYVLQPRVDPPETEAGPSRIISMAPALTEICWALGLGGRMVGRTQYCIYPPAAQRIEVVGALLDPNIERILALRPDLVVITRGSAVLREKFEGLKLPLQVLPTDSLEDIYIAIEQLGQATGRPKTAALLVRDLRADLGRLRQQAAEVSRARPRKVLFVTGALPSPPKGVWVAGPGSYLDALLGLAGATNVVAGDRAWLEIGTEQVLWMRPETIVEVREPAEAGRQSRGGRGVARPSRPGKRADRDADGHRRGVPRAAGECDAGQAD